ncbi:MAG: MarC family protein [Candidatus Omnitrophica bacterium]|nr:MarC family protein [Candidatus Omnitrophota bacterium]
MRLFLSCFLALLALINPISKIFFLITLTKKGSGISLVKISIQATAIALFILLSFAVLGNFILNNIFHVDIYALKIVGGMVLLQRGFLALNKGVFFDIKSMKRLEEISIVPLSSPMIAGPATIAAAVSFHTQFGVGVTNFAIVAALLVNLLAMLLSRPINKILSRFHLVGALIRITGLIVSAIGAQMILGGIEEYIYVLKN